MAELADPMDVARDLFPDLPPGFPYEGFELEELILPSGDDMGIRSDEDDVKEEDVQTESGFGSVVGGQSMQRQRPGASATAAVLWCGEVRVVAAAAVGSAPRLTGCGCCCCSGPLCAQS